MTTTATASIAVTTGILTASAISAGGVIQPGAIVTGPGVDSGPIYGGAITAAGNSYDANGSGTFTAINLTGGSGTGAQATLVVTSGAISACTITNAGTNYRSGDVLSAGVVGSGAPGAAFAYTISVAPRAPPVIIQPYGTSGTTGTGGNGTYATNIATAVASTTMTFTLGEPPINTLQLQGVPTPVPAWNSATAYVAQNIPSGIEGSVVAVGGLYYLCILANTNQTPPNPTYWELLPESMPLVYTGGPVNTLNQVKAPLFGSYAIPPKPLPSGTANTAIGIPI
jgi:hypothetical protein